MVGYGLKLAGAAILFLIVGILGIVVFSGIWSRIGIGAAIVVVFGGAVVLVWRADRKAKRSREGLERI